MYRYRLFSVAFVFVLHALVLIFLQNDWLSQPQLPAPLPEVTVQLRPASAAAKAPARLSEHKPVVHKSRPQPTPVRPVPTPKVPAFVKPVAADAPVSVPVAAPSTAMNTTATATTPTPTANPAPATEPGYQAARSDAAYLNNPKPVYPRMSRQLQENGKVVLRVYVDAQGMPAKVEMRTSSGFSRLDNAALEAVKRWRFVPAKRGDEPIADWVSVPINFNLDS